MEYWILFTIGVVITIGTRIAIYFMTYYDDDIDECNLISRILIHIFVAICISLVGGIIVGKWIGILQLSEISGFLDWLLTIVFAIFLPVGLTYIVGSWIMKFDAFNDRSVICFIIIYVISVVGWSISICNYNSNIEVSTEKAIINTKQERQLLYFCNVPVQKVSGNIKGRSMLGTGKVKGDVITTDELTYWYLNENGDGISDTALSANSVIDFIEEGEDVNPYVEIIEYCDKKTTTNNNNGQVSIEKNNLWTKYVFHLPKDIMEYNLN